MRSTINWLKYAMLFLLLTVATTFLQSCKIVDDSTIYEPLSVNNCSELAQMLKKTLGVPVEIVEAPYPDYVVEGKWDIGCNIKAIGSNVEWEAPWEALNKTGWNEDRSAFAARTEGDRVVVSQNLFEKENAYCILITALNSTDETLPNQQTIDVTLNCVQSIRPSKWISWVNTNGIQILGGILLLGIIGIILRTKSNNIVTGCMGAFLSAPTIAFFMGILFALSLSIADDRFMNWNLIEPSETDTINAWLDYGFRGGAAIFVFTIFLALITFIVSFVSGLGPDFKVIRIGNIIRVFGPKSSGIGKEGSGCIALIAAIMLGAIPYGLVYGMTKYLLYKQGWGDLAKHDIIPWLVMTTLLWGLGGLISVMATND